MCWTWPERNIICLNAMKLRRYLSSTSIYEFLCAFYMRGAAAFVCVFQRALPTTHVHSTIKYDLLQISLLDSQFLRLHQMSISITFNTIHSCQLTHTHTWSLSFRKKTTIQPQWASSQLKALTSKWIYRITISTTTSHLSNWSIYLFVEK